MDINAAVILAADRMRPFDVAIAAPGKGIAFSLPVSSAAQLPECVELKLEIVTQGGMTLTTNAHGKIFSRDIRKEERSTRLLLIFATDISLSARELELARFKLRSAVLDTTSRAVGDAVFYWKDI